MMAGAPENQRLPLGSFFQQQTADAIKTFVGGCESNFRWLDDVLQEAKARFGRRERTDLLPKTPCMKKKSTRSTRKNVKQNYQNTDLSSTEDEQESKPAVSLPLQAIFENSVLDTSNAIDEAEMKRGKRKKRSQQQQPKKNIRSSKRQILEEPENTPPKRVTRSKKKKTSSKVLHVSEPPTVTAATGRKTAVICEVASSDIEEHSIICEIKKETEPQPERSSRSSRKHILAEANIALESTSIEEEDCPPKRVTRSKRKKNVSRVVLGNTSTEEEDNPPPRLIQSHWKKNIQSSVSQSPAVDGAVTETQVSSEAASRNTGRQSLVSKSTEKPQPREQITTEVISEHGNTTEAKLQDTNLQPEESSTGHKLSADEEQKKTGGMTIFIPKTPELPHQSVPSSKKACRTSVTVKLEPVMPNQADKSLICRPSEQIPTEVISDPDSSTEAKLQEMSLDVQGPSKKRKVSAADEKSTTMERVTVIPETSQVHSQSPPPYSNSASGSSLTVKLEAVTQHQGGPTGDRGSGNVKIATHCKAPEPTATISEELACSKEVKHAGDTGDHTADFKSNTGNTAISLTVGSTEEAQPDSNKCNTRSTRSSQMSSKVSFSGSLTKTKSAQKTYSLVKSCVTLTLTQTPLLPTSKIPEKCNSSSPGESTDAEQNPAMSDLKQDLFGVFNDGSDSDGRRHPTSSSQSAEEWEPTTGNVLGSNVNNLDGVDGEGYVTSKEEDASEGEEVFHDAKEEQEKPVAIESKRENVFASPILEKKTSSGSEQGSASAEEVESDEAKHLNLPEKQRVVVAGPNKKDKPSNLVAIHSFIRRDTPKKVNPEEEKKKRVIALQKKQEKEKERKEQLEIQRQKEAEERKRKRKEREKRVADLRAQKAKVDEERKRKMQKRLEQKKNADEKAKKRREMEEDSKKRLRQQKKAELDARRKQDEVTRKQKLLEQEEEGKRQRELVQMKLGFEEQERQRKIAEMKRQQELREKELDRERELEKMRRLREIEEKEKKVREKEEREREEKAKKAAEEKDKRAREKDEREREEKAKRAAEEKEKMGLKAKEAEEKLEKERVRITKLIREKEEQQRLEKMCQENEKKLKEAREAERKRQEEIKRQETAEKQRKAAGEPRKAVAVESSYQMTPPPPPKAKKTASKENYDITDLCSDDSTDDEDAPRKIIPSWAKGNALWATLLNQQFSAADGHAIFGSILPPNLDAIFEKKRKRFHQRTSSACWNSPPPKVQVHGTDV